MKYPIFIPIKGNSIRCHGKNRILLPIMTSILKTFNNYDSNILNECIIITESDELIELAKKLGYNNIYKEHTSNKSEFHAIIKCIEEYNNKEISFNNEPSDGFDMRYFFLAPVTQPLKTFSFYQYIYNNKINNLLKNSTFITTICTEQDRSIFEYNIKEHKFEVESKCRKGILCKDKYYIDGCWYFIKTENISNMIYSLNNIETYKNKDINELFWSSKFNVKINDDYLFCDIDNQIDLYKLFNTITISNKINNK